jgi:hypothetical protein
MKLMTLAAAAAALLTTSIAAAPAEAQPVRERTVVKTTVVRSHGRHMGWRNHHRWQRRHHSRVCRVTVRHHTRHRVCTTRW